jgi:hypothetical protein
MYLPLYAQTETFDIATYIAPKAWQRIDSNGVRLYQDSRTNNGLASFCQIFLYPSQASNNSPEKNFEMEWMNKVSKFTGNKTIPKTGKGTTTDNWTVVTGTSTISQQGITYTCMLSCISGFGKMMTVVVNVAGQDYADEVQVFFEHMDMHAEYVAGNVWNGNDTPPGTATNSQDNYTFAAPQGWAAQKFTDGGIILSSPVYTGGEKCSMTLLPMRASSGNLQNDATAILFESFKGFQPAQSPEATLPSMIKGISPQGWEYFIVKKFMKPPGNFAVIMTFAFVAKLGNQVAAIVGSSKDPLVSACFGELQTNVWPKFFYSLQFKNWKPATSENALAKKLPGIWMAATATAGDRFVFASNGRFAGASASQRYYNLSSSQLLTVTDAYFGDGAYRINNNQILLTKDSNKSSPDKGWFRIEQESKDDGRTWKDKLYLLRTSIVDGKEYELCYERQSQ